MNKASVLVLCVNYNTRENLLRYLNSLYKSERLVASSLGLDVVVSDNSKDQVTSEYLVPYIDHQLRYLHTGNNLGYLGAINYAIEKLKINLSSYDFVIISNVDLVVEVSFFASLLDLGVDESIGWIAPSIYSLKENRDRNPKIISRIKKHKILLAILVYLHPIIHKLYERNIYSTKERPECPSGMSIYAGHGSFMILTRAFLASNPDIRYFSFLFGEEIFFAELVRMAGLKVVYNTDLKIIDSDHESTGKLRSKELCRMNRESLLKLYSKFF